MCSTPFNILIIRFSSIGDILLTTPFLRQLRTKFPDAHIRYITKDIFTDLLAFNPAIDTVIPFDASRGVKGIRQIAGELSAVTFDFVFDLHDNQRSHLLTRGLKRRHLVRLQKHRIRRAAYVYLKQRTSLRPVARRYMDTAPDLPDNGEGLELFVPPEASQNILPHLQSLAGKPFICLAPGAGFATKRWPGAYWTKLTHKILDNSAWNLVIVGGPGDHKRIQGDSPRIINLAGKLSLLESAAVIKASRGIVCNDSGLMHMAAAAGIPIIAIFGSTTPELGFAPFRARETIVQGPELWCRPCSHIGRKKCPLGHFKCMQAITVDAVLRAASSMLDNGLDPFPAR